MEFNASKIENSREESDFCKMTDSKTPKNVACMIIKKSMETPSPQKEDSSMDELSSVISLTSSSCSSGELSFMCASCKRRMYESRSETPSEDDGNDSNNTYDISDVDSLNISSTTYSLSGSGYISMDGSSSMDESGWNSEEGSDTSCYFCDRSASSSSSMDTEDYGTESTSEDDRNVTLLLERECWCKKSLFIEIEE